MKAYNIRVYGIIVNGNEEVLISDERRHGQSFSKFPGGGLEWGEGFKDCLTRELQEELQIDVESAELFYLTEHFQKSAFNEDHQLISIYYAVKSFDGVIETHDHEVPMIFEGEEFRWLRLDQSNTDDLTFPIDKLVLNKLVKEHQ